MHASTTRIRSRRHAIDPLHPGWHSCWSRLGVYECGAAPGGRCSCASVRRVSGHGGEPGMQDHAAVADDHQRNGSRRHGRRPHDRAASARQAAPDHGLAHPSRPAAPAPTVAASGHRHHRDDNATITCAGYLYLADACRADAGSGVSLWTGRLARVSPDWAGTGRRARRLHDRWSDEAAGLRRLASSRSNRLARTADVVSVADARVSGTGYVRSTCPCSSVFLAFIAGAGALALVVLVADCGATPP